MKILIISTGKMGGGYMRMQAIKHFLQSNNHDINVIKFPDNNYLSKAWNLYQRARSKLHINVREKRLMNKIADKTEKIIEKDHYDVIISFETLFSHVLTRELSCLKIFFCEALIADELYFSKRVNNLERIRHIREMELEILMKSDYVIFPWETTENYVRKYVWNGNNFITIKYGCYPQEKTAFYFFPISIVSLGNIRYYWANKELLSYLTKLSPYVIDIYGSYKPEKKYSINYKGFAKSLDVLSNYQFGLNTISKDIFRRNHFSSRIMSYLAYGLPVLSPDWMEYPKDLKGCLHYNRDNFLDIIEEYSERDNWEKISKDAMRQANELNWNRTLEPLLKIINK